MNHADRLSTLRASLDRPLLVSNLVNIRYLTGFTGSSAYLAVWPERTVFLTDGRYAELAEDLVSDLPDTELDVWTSGLTEKLAQVLGGLAAVSVEADAMTWDMARRLGDAVDGELVPTMGVVERQRITKDSDEIAALRRAAAIGDAAFAVVEDLVTGAPSEGELGWALVTEMRARGGEAAGWDPIVAAGSHASIPHYRSGEAPVGSGLLLLDYGCVVDGYHSDMSRTLWLDGEPGVELNRMYRAVLEAQEEAIAAVAPGVAAGDVDAAARRVLAGFGYEEHFLHSTGHGVGLEIHEAPWVRRHSDTTLAAGHVITVEPGVYVPGVGGVRIEDMVLVGATPEVLTASPKDLTLS